MLYIIATPIGNLEDITKRALRILGEVDLILCEDTRVTQRLLDNYNIKVSTFSYHQHSNLRKVNQIVDVLNQGKDVALVSDAGTPGVSDPGNKLVKEVLEKCPNVDIVPIPGTSAVTAAASISGFPMDKFLFLGFPPHKKKRKKFFEQIINSEYPVIFYESCHRIIKSLQELKEMESESGRDLSLVVCRELTKQFETIYRGDIDKVISQLQQDKIKGEFVVIVS